jgi:hypothetical protein
MIVLIAMTMAGGGSRTFDSLRLFWKGEVEND